MTNILLRLDVLEQRMNELQNPDRYSAIRKNSKNVRKSILDNQLIYEVDQLKEIIGVR